MIARRMRRVAFLTCQTMLLVLFATNNRAARAQQDKLADPADLSAGRAVQVVDEQGHPIERAMIQVSVWTDEPFNKNRSYFCDREGKTRIQLPSTLRILRIWASKKGFVETFLNLQSNTQAGQPVVPEKFVFTLPKGTVMGGVIHDQQGQPVRGAKVTLSVDSGVNQLGVIRAVVDGSRTTDAEGRWTFDNVPPGDDVQATVAVAHPDFTPEEFRGKLQREQLVTTKQLRDQTATIVLSRGTALSGRVTDPTGKPVAGAVVIWGERPYFQSGSQETRTDNDGRFQFASLASGPLRLTVVAAGWSPAERKIELGPATGTTDIQLEPGKKLRLQFVDPAGNAVPEVMVQIAKWHGAEALYNHKHSNVMEVAIPRVADGQGVFEWDAAPGDAVEYRFGKANFALVTATITADGSEHVQVLNPELTFSGTVRDAKTDLPIDDFLVLPVIYFTAEFHILDRMHAERARRGTFSLAGKRTDIEHGVQIEAPGYRTFRTNRRYKIGDQIPKFDIRLEPADRAIGGVVDAAGAPVAGARVFLATAFQELELDDFEERSEINSNYRTTAGDDGTFEFVPQVDPYVVVAVAKQGFGTVERDAGEVPGNIELRPWAKVSGKLSQGGKPMPNCPVYLEAIRVNAADEARLNFISTTQTDADGTYAFDRVPPIPCRVRAFLHFSRPSPLKSGPSVPIDLRPGEDAKVDLAGPGAEVTGQLIAENQPADFDYHFSINFLVAKRSGIAPPAGLAAKGFDWQRGWSESWRHSREGSAYLDTLHHWFVKPDPDGHFRVSGVTPGEYEFAVALYGSTEGCLVHPLAMRVIPISVPEGAENLDLGRLSIPSMPVPRVGDHAPEFEFIQLDGTKTQLAALRGKHVLIDFWATWCRPCVDKMAEVERLRARYGDDKLVVIGANLDVDTQQSREFLDKRSLPWRHAFLGEWTNTDVPRRFGVTSVPAYVLVDPDGKIEAQEYLLDELEKKLEGALK